MDIKQKYFPDWLNRGRELYAQKSYLASLEAYKKAISIFGDSAEAWHGKGNALETLGREEDAKKAFSKATKLGYKG